MLQKLFPFWSDRNKSLKHSIDISTKQHDVRNIHSLSVILHPNDSVDIIMMHPDLEKFSISEISNEAEKFAELLVYITNAPMEPRLLAVITNKGKNTESMKEQLFYDNVISYYQLIKRELEKTVSDSGPVIRPIAAFNLK